MKNKGWARTFVLAGGHFWVDYYANMLPTILPLISGLWGLSNSQLALIVSVQSLTGNLLQPFFGYLLDKKSRYSLLGIALAIMAVPMSFIYLAGNYLAFAVFVTVAGIGASLYHPLGASKSIEGAGSEQALKVSVYSGMGSLGFAFSPVITALIIAAWGLKGLSYTIVPSILWLVLLIVVRQFSKPRSNEGKVEVASGERFMSKEELMMSEASADETNKVPQQNIKPLIFINIIVACRSWLISACTIFFPVWMLGRGMDGRLAGLYLSPFLLAGTAGGFVFGYLYPRFGAKLLLLSSFAASLLLLPLLPMANNIWLAVLIAAFGFVLIGSTPITIVMAQNLMPKRAGLASGLTMGFAFGIGGLGTYLTGFWADSFGVMNALYLSSLILIPAGIYTVLLVRNRVIMAQNQAV